MNVLVLYLLCSAASIWMALAAWNSVDLLLSSIPEFRAGRHLAGSAMAIVAVLAAMASLGILRRRKFGAAALALTYALLIAAAPFL